MNTLASLVRKVAAISTETLGRDVRARFEDDCALRLLAVCDSENFVLGTIERAAFMGFFSNGFARDLYERRPIGALMTPEPVCVDIATRIDDVARALNARGADSLSAGAVILLDGRYFGIVDTAEVYRKLTHLLDQKATQLEAARNAAEVARDAKSNFLAAMSHEIRTPLNGVLGMAQALAFSGLNPAQLEMVAVISDSGDVLMRLLDDVLDMSKIDAGKLSIEVADVDIRLLLTTATSLYQERAELKGIAFEVCVNNVPDGLYVADSARLKQIIYNIVSNAVKFTHSGGVSVIAFMDDPQSDQSVLRIEVRDSGIGMTEASIDRLFQPFEQADASTTRQYGGTGLGLSICRSLLTLMGGKVDVTSVIGHGSCFQITVPLPRALKQSPDIGLQGQIAAVASDLDDRHGKATDTLHVLVAEDNETNRFVLKTLLLQFDIDLTFAENGLEALDHFKAKSFDLVLMDLQMPVMGGLDATRAIRSFERATGRSSVPILALSANAMPRHVAEAMEAGMNGHVAKPISLPILMAAITTCLAQRDDEKILAA